MNCYIDNLDSDAILPDFLNKENTLFYPEGDMTTHEKVNTTKPNGFNIVTDCHFLVPLYSKENVFMWDGSKWVNPNFQTYGLSYTATLRRFWGISNTIPKCVILHYEELAKHING